MAETKTSPCPWPKPPGAVCRISQTRRTLSGGFITTTACFPRRLACSRWPSSSHRKILHITIIWAWPIKRPMILPVPLSSLNVHWNCTQRRSRRAKFARRSARMPAAKRFHGDQYRMQTHYDLVCGLRDGVRLCLLGASAQADASGPCLRNVLAHLDRSFREHRHGVDGTRTRVPGSGTEPLVRCRLVRCRRFARCVRLEELVLFWGRRLVGPRHRGFFVPDLGWLPLILWRVGF